MPKIQKLEIGDWFDLRNSEREVLLGGRATRIPLGIAMKLPPGFEAIIAPRSSSFKNWGVLQTNSPGVVDETFCGNDDEWQWSVYPTRDVMIEPYQRICQFRIQEKQPDIVFTEVSNLKSPNRNGFGSSGTT